MRVECDGKAWREAAHARELGSSGASVPDSSARRLRFIRAVRGTPRNSEEPRDFFLRASKRAAELREELPTFRPFAVAGGGVQVSRFADHDQS